MSNEDINRLPNNPGTERAENLLGSRYNPMEYADIKSYFKPEETSARLNHLEQALEGKTPDQQSEIRSDWLNNLADEATWK